MNQQHQIQLGLLKRIAGSALGGMAATLARWRRFRTRPGPVSRSPSVLILEPYGMGDLISLEPLVRELRRRNMEVRISARAAWRPLYPPSVVPRWLDAVIPWTSYDSKSKYRWSSLAAPPFGKYLADLCRLADGVIGIDPRGDVRSVLLLQWAGCREVLSLESYLGTGLRIPPSAATLVPFREGARRWELNLQFLQPLSADSSSQSSPPRFEHFPPVSKAAGARRIGLVPVAPWTGKFWRRENWGQLIRLLQSDRWDVRGLCGPQQSAIASHELDDCAQVEECAGVESWAERLGSLDGLITVDSGPMHLADALGVPVVALFGQGKLPLWAPSGPRSRVVSHQTDSDFVLCHPIDANAHLGREFMNRITVREVADALRAVL